MTTACLPRLFSRNEQTPVPLSGMIQVLKSIVFLATVLVGHVAHARMGLAELPADAISGPITVFYPSEGIEGRVVRGAFGFNAASEGPPSAGNRRLVVISHGSPSSPWVHVDLARALVTVGFTVAVPEHQGDNARSHDESGPVSWKRKPLEVSRAIDRLAQEPRWSKPEFRREAEVPRLNAAVSGFFQRQLLPSK